MLGVGGERVDVSALPFGINGVESQRGFSAAAKTGYDHELIAWNVHVYVLEVIRLRTAYFDIFFFIFHRTGKFSNSLFCGQILNFTN